jgi:hypothetical protein
MFIRILFLTLLSLYIPLGNAGELVMVALNLQRCERWHFEGGDFPPAGYQRFCTSCPDLKDYWITLYAESRSSKRAGVCNFKRDSQGEHFYLYRCEESVGFPMSGATYRQISKSGLPTYECIKGCTESTAKRVYDQGWESDVPNFEYEKDRDEFKRKCEPSKP